MEKKKKNGEMEMDGWGILRWIDRIYTFFLPSFLSFILFSGEDFVFRFREERGRVVDSQICRVKGSVLVSVD